MGDFSFIIQDSRRERNKEIFTVTGHLASLLPESEALPDPFPDLPVLLQVKEQALYRPVLLLLFDILNVIIMHSECQKFYHTGSREVSDAGILCTGFSDTGRAIFSPLSDFLRHL